MTRLFLSLSIAPLILVFNSPAKANLPASLKRACKQDLLNTWKIGNSNAGKKASRVRYEVDKKDVVVFHGQVTTHFLQILDQLPSNIKTVALELPQGGHAIAALLIAEKIRQKGLNTYVGLTRCHSACTIIFQGGKQRFVDSMTAFSYHGPGNVESGDLCSKEILNLGAKKMISLGFPKDSLKILRSSSEYYFLDSSQLINLGIATGKKSLNIGIDSILRKAWLAEQDYCEENPDDDDC